MSDSLKKRYVYKLIVNAISIPSFFITQAIATRMLGPGLYGNFNFLFSFFTPIIGFFHSGSSECLYTKLSQRPNDKGLILFFIKFSAIVTLLMLGLCAIVLSTNIADWVWPSISPRYVIAALVLAILYQLSQNIIRIFDAYGCTVQGESIRIFQRFASPLSLWILFTAGATSLGLFFLHQSFTWLIILLPGAYLIWKHSNRLETDPFKKRYFNEFFTYAAPLFVYAFFGMLSVSGERWILQAYGGSQEQAYYSLGQQLALGSFLLTSAFTPLFTRELSQSFAKNDIKKVKSEIETYVPLFFLFSTAISILLVSNADLITLWIGGESFHDASLAVAIMLIYPIHQAYGQLIGSYYYSSGETQTYRNIGIFICALGLFTCYLFIAPDYLNLGAVGMAYKMVIVQFVQVHLLLVPLCKRLQIPIAKFIKHQILTLGVCCSIAYVSKLFILFILPQSSILAAALSAFLYITCLFVAIYFIPTFSKPIRSVLSHKTSNL